MAPRVLAIVQARMGSTRLPGKALRAIAGRPMLAHVMARAAAIPGVREVVLATTRYREDDALVTLARSAGWAWARGSAEDVLDRFRSVLLDHPADVVVRVTGDCPLLDPAMSGLVLQAFLRRAGDVDYVSNVDPPSYPDGLDTEVFSRAALGRAWREARRPTDREHVTPYLRAPAHEFRRENVTYSDDLSAHRWTVDTARDLAFVREIYGALTPAGDRIFGMAEILALLRARPDLLSRSLAETRSLVAAR